MRPIVTTDFSEEEAFAYMKESDNFYLPVFDKGLLIGVVSIFSLTEYFMRRCSLPIK
jgi:CBS domain-containing protein